MNDIQQKILEIYAYFQAICQRHDLRYYAEGGTKMGAVLYQGFIPWDDDLDVVMPLADYDRFIAIMKEQGAGPYELLDRKDFIKLHAPETAFIHYDTLLDDSRLTGIYIDIAPMVGTPAEPDQRQGFVRDLSELIAEYRIESVHGGSSARLGKIEKQIDRLRQCYDFDTSEYVCHGATPEKETFARDSFVETSDMAFETMTIPVSVGYHAQLLQQYGSYSLNPPESKRVQHADWSFASTQISYHDKMAGDSADLYIAGYQHAMRMLGQLRRAMHKQMLTDSGSQMSGHHGDQSRAHLDFLLERRWFHALFVDRSGVPRWAVRRILFHSDGHVRPRFRSFVRRHSGSPAAPFYLWVRRPTA